MNDEVKVLIEEIDADEELEDSKRAELKAELKVASMKVKLSES